MSKYYCPYCNSKYQFKSISNTGKLLCSLCGEEMIKKSFINIKQIISLTIVITFVLPLIYTFVLSIINKKDLKKDIYQTSNGHIIGALIDIFFEILFINN